MAKQRKTKEPKAEEAPKETPEDILNRQAVELAILFLADGPLSHLRISHFLSVKKGKPIEPAVIWRALANSPVFNYSHNDNLFRLNQST